MPELRGDYMRAAARLVESAVADTATARAMVMRTARAEDHMCEMTVVAVFLASVLAHAADEAGEDLSGMLAKWRQTAGQIDAASGEAPSPN